MLDWVQDNPALFAGLVFAAILVLYVARPYAHALLKSLLSAPGEVLRGAALRLRAESRRIDRRFKERVREHQVEELEQRLNRMMGRLDGRVQGDVDRADRLIDELRDAAAGVVKAADGLDPRTLAARAAGDLKAAVEAEGGSSRNLRGAISQAEARFAQAAREARDGARAIKPEARHLQSLARKLKEIDERIDRNTREINLAAESYRNNLRSDLRKDAAAGASIFVPWAAAVVVIAVAAAGAFLNFQLVQRPMAELVGDGARVGGLSLPSIAAITLIFLEAACGVVLMEAIGATKLLPVFSRMSGRMTLVFAIMALVFLAAFSVVEVALAFTREAIILLDQDVMRAAAGDSAASAAAGASASPFALLAQALLGAAIPWILAVVAIPAETVIANTRFIVEVIWKQVLALCAFLLAAVGGVVKAASTLLLAVYDFTIFPALAVERLVRGGKSDDASPGRGDRARAGRDAVDLVPPRKMKVIGGGRA